MRHKTADLWNGVTPLYKKIIQLSKRICVLIPISIINCAFDKKYYFHLINSNDYLDYIDSSQCQWRTKTDCRD